MSVCSGLRVVDTDTHLTEPPDLWTSRMPRKWLAEAPRVEVEPRSGRPRWRVGDDWLMAVGMMSSAGWREFYPSVPPTFEDIDASCFEPEARVRWMDQYGIDTQILYPNIIAFEGHGILKLADEALRIQIIRVYNDYVTEFAAAKPGRFVPLASMPFWDVEASIAEMQRCADMGHRGVIWAATLDRHGLPHHTDPYWDRFYDAAQHLEMSINFHVGVGAVDEGRSPEERFERLQSFDPAYYTGFIAQAFMGNARTICDVIMTGLCHRFPRLNFVSVESGFGYVPYLIEGLDWQWRNLDAGRAYPDRLLPSEYFRRQIYVMYWFEQTTLPLLDLYPDNVMFQTDFPHSTSLSPGPGSASPSPRELVERNVERLGPELMAKVLHANAERLYRL